MQCCTTSRHILTFEVKIKSVYTALLTVSAAEHRTENNYENEQKTVKRKQPHHADNKKQQ